MRLFLSTVAASLMVVAPSFAIEPAVELEVMGLQQRFARVMELNEQLMVDLRDLQRKVDHLYKINEDQDQKYNDLVDTLLKLENISIANLNSGQKGLYEQIPNFTWGQGAEDCPKIGSKHQQINMVKSEDGTRSMRFLCFDGKAIHLGTEVNSPPQ